MRGAEGELLGFAKICRDLSERKAAEDERARLLAAEQTARREAEAANAAKDRFLAALSHELRTPLAPVQMALFVLRREPQLERGGRDGLEMIRRNVELEARLIDDLLDVSRIAHGKLELTTGAASVHDCVRRAVEVCQGELDDRGLELTLALDAARDGVQGDAARLQQVFWNLLKNAAKFTPERGRVVVRSRDVDGVGSSWKWRTRGSGSRRRRCRGFSGRSSRARRRSRASTAGWDWGCRFPRRSCRLTAAG